MTETNIKKCIGYHSSCERAAYADGYCQLHLPSDHTVRLNCDEYDTLLLDEIKSAIPNKKGLYVLKWQGFNFPDNHVLFNYTKFHEVKDRLVCAWFERASGTM